MLLHPLVAKLEFYPPRKRRSRIMQGSQLRLASWGRAKLASEGIRGRFPFSEGGGKFFDDPSQAIPAKFVYARGVITGDRFTQNISFVNKSGVEVAKGIRSSNCGINNF